MERWLIVGFMGALLAVLAAAGWHFQQTNQAPMAACAVAEAHCGEERP